MEGIVRLQRFLNTSKRLYRFESVTSLFVHSNFILSCRGIYSGLRCYQIATVCKHGQIRQNLIANTKLFFEGENSYAHSILENLPIYSSTLAPLQLEKRDVTHEQFKNITRKDWTEESCDSVYNAFETVSHYVNVHSHDISSELFDNLCDNLSKKCVELDDDRLIRILHCLRYWPLAKKVDASNFSNIWTSVDKECVKRIKTWDLNKVLYVSDHWYKLNLVRKSNFMWYANFKLAKKPSRLLPHQLIQCLFYINVFRKWHPECKKFEVEYTVDKTLEKLTLDEIAIFAMGFFKSETKIHNPNLISEIISRTKNEVDCLHEISLAAILKVVRYSVSPMHLDMLYDLMDKLKDQVPRLSIPTLVHIALAGTNVQLCHYGLLQSVSQRFCDEIHSARLKDLERIIFALTLFDFNPQTNPCIYKSVSEELKKIGRETEIQEHVKCLPCCVYYFTLKNMYHLDIIDKVLNPEYIRNAYGKNDFGYGRELLCLDVGIEVDCPNYTGNRLPQKTRERMAKGSWLAEMLDQE